METKTKELTDLVREHIQNLDPYADIVLIFPQGTNANEDIHIYAFLPQKVDYATEQRYLDARYKVEFESGKSISLYTFFKEDWHRQFKDTPIYQKIQNEGLIL